MLFTKYSILILACAGALTGVIIAFKGFPAAWKKCRENDVSVFMLFALTLNPLSEAIYGWITIMLMSSMIQTGKQDQDVSSKFIVAGLIIGLIFFLAAVIKAFIARKGCRVISETGQGFKKYMIISGGVETVAVLAAVLGPFALKLIVR